MSVLVKEAVELVGSTFVGKYGAISISEMASYIQHMGSFNSYEAAYRAAQNAGEYWYSDVMRAVNSEIQAVNLKITSGGAAEAVSSTTETALEVAQSSTLTATNTEISSGVVTIADTSGGAGTSFGFKALLQADVGIMSAAMAPILGVSLGTALYESNPELWTKISQTLLPFCYEDTTMMPFWGTVDALGNWEASVATDAINALRNLFTEEIPEIPAPSPTEFEPGTYSTGGMSVADIARTITMAPGYSLPDLTPYENVTGASAWKEQWFPIAPGADPYGGTGTITISEGGHVDIDGINITIRSGPLGATEVSIGPGRISFTPDYVSAGSDPYTPGERIYPEGTSKWNGSTPSSTTADPIIDEDGNPVDTTPISMPYSVPDSWTPGLPAPSADPTVQPDPSATTDPNKQISPYIAPMPVPWDTIYPQPSPTVDPESNPSVPTPPKSSFIDAVPLPPAPTGNSPVPNMPTTSTPFSANVGLVTVYHPTDAELYAFENWLWVTYADATIDKIWNNPFDGIITLFELYCTPTDIGNRTIHSGFLDSGVNSAIISRYTEIDCGSIGVPEWYGNYLDYSPYTKAHIYLPFIGIQELNPDDIVGHGVNVTYRIDEYNGSCIAMITVAKSTTVNGEEVEYSNTMYQFSGNCAVELPITGGSQAAIKAGMMQADAYQTAGLISTGANLLGGIGSALMGNLGGAISGVGGAASSYAYAQANYLSNMLSGKSTVQKSGSFGASHGALGIKTPFITITRPKQIQVANYEKLYGYPAHKMVTIGNCTGFLRCREVNVVSATANDEEKALIEQLLKAGVYVTE